VNYLVSIIMGSDSDLPVMQSAANVLEELGVAYELDIVSAHRTPDRLYEFGRTAATRGVSVIIAGAGGAAHLPGMVASLTPLPVIGVPISATAMIGTDALHSIVQMPAGVPVATVAIDNARNAGILAAQIVGVADSRVREAIVNMKAEMESRVMAAAAKVAGS
jgi:5-(carboxyamino)imidazole ribonucleotide mutase